MVGCRLVTSDVSEDEMSPISRPASRLTLAVAAIPLSAGSIFLGAATSSARGDLVLQVLDSSAIAGGTGSFDVVFKETNGGTDSVASETIELSVPSNSGVTFTGVNVNTDPIAEPYIFGTLQLPTFTSDTFPNTQFEAFDFYLQLPYARVLNDGDIAGAAHVTYAVASGASAGDVPVSFGSDIGAGDASSVPIPLTLDNGTIDVTSPTNHPILSLTAGSPGNTYGNQITNGAPGIDKGRFSSPGASSNKLTVVGSDGSYILAQVSGMGTAGGGDPSNFVEVSGFSPSDDDELFALDVKVGGVQANATQISTLISEIDSFSGGLPTGLSVSSSLTVDPFASNYNLFLTAAPGVASDDFLGFDLSQSNDSNLVGYTVSAVAVIPEPLSLGLLAIGGMSLLARRSRRR
jgi:hypothetical protein